MVSCGTGMNDLTSGGHTQCACVSKLMFMNCAYDMNHLIVEMDIQWNLQ